MICFTDIFKSSFLENIEAFSLSDTIIGLVVSLALGLFIFLIYKLTFSGVMYSSGFALTLPGLSLVTSLVIMAVTSNVVLSLGMVGALSIVRFRAAIKEPMEIVFLFWALAVGIVVGAGMILLAVIGSVLIGLFLFLFGKAKTFSKPYILVVNCKNEVAENEALAAVKTSVKKYIIKSKTVSANGIEFTVEMRLSALATDFVNKICAIEGVDNAVLVSYNGEYMS